MNGINHCQMGGYGIGLPRHFMCLHLSPICCKADARGVEKTYLEARPAGLSVEIGEGHLSTRQIRMVIGYGIWVYAIAGL